MMVIKLVFRIIRKSLNFVFMRKPIWVSQVGVWNRKNNCEFDLSKEKEKILFSLHLILYTEKFKRLVEIEYNVQKEKDRINFILRTPPHAHTHTHSIVYLRKASQVSQFTVQTQKLTAMFWLRPLPSHFPASFIFFSGTRKIRVTSRDVEEPSLAYSSTGSEDVQQKVETFTETSLANITPHVRVIAPTRTK